MRDAFGVERHDVSKGLFSALKAGRVLGKKPPVSKPHLTPDWKFDPQAVRAEQRMRSGIPTAPKQAAPKAPENKGPLPWSGDGSPVGRRYNGHDSAHTYARRAGDHKGAIIHGVDGSINRGARVTAGQDPKTGHRLVTLHYNESRPSKSFREHEIHALALNR